MQHPVVISLTEITDIACGHLRLSPEYSFIVGLKEDEKPMQVNYQGAEMMMIHPIFI